MARAKESTRRGEVMASLNDMARGWFVGDFHPTAFQTGACEVGVKNYQTGDSESLHYHKIATEVTLIQSGRVRMNDVEYGTGDIIVIKPFESTDFHALEDTVTVVVKVPGAKDDKYFGRAEGQGR